MNQLLDLATEAYGGLETFSRLGFPTLRRVVQRMSAGPALYGPTAFCCRLRVSLVFLTRVLRRRGKCQRPVIFRPR